MGCAGQRAEAEHQAAQFGPLAPPDELGRSQGCQKCRGQRHDLWHDGRRRAAQDVDESAVLSAVVVEVGDVRVDDIWPLVAIATVHQEK